MTQIKLECRPQTIFAALYDDMPFPIVGPVQEVAFDVGVTAVGGPVELAGLIFSGYHKRQQLFEQRWASRVIMARTGEDNTRMERELSGLLDGRKVDLRTQQDLSRYFRQQVVQEAEVQYEQR